MATQLTAISLKDNKERGIGGATYRKATYWLQLASLTSLQRLELRGRLLPVQLLPAASAALVQLRRLTALVLEGGYRDDAEAGDALDELSETLLTLTELSELGPRKFRVGDAGMHALRGTLAGLPRLCALDLTCLVKTDTQPADRVMTGVPACTALTKLDLTACRLEAGCGGVRALCGMRTPLLSLTLDANLTLGTAGVCNILAVSSLTCLTRVGLSDVGFSSTGPWPWLQLCALTRLQELLLRGNHLSDAGTSALAPHIVALAQLRRLDISDCGLTAAGALAHALWRLPRLQQLACEQSRPMAAPFELSADARARGLELVARIE